MSLNTCLIILVLKKSCNVLGIEFISSIRLPGLLFSVLSWILPLYVYSSSNVPDFQFCIQYILSLVLLLFLCLGDNFCILLRTQVTSFEKCFLLSSIEKQAFSLNFENILAINLFMHLFHVFVSIFMLSLSPILSKSAI